MSYIDEMKGAMRAYRTSMKEATARVDSIRENYGDEAAQREQARQEKALASARTSAQQKIRDAYAGAVRSVEQWGTLDGSRLTDDAKLLQSGLVSPDQFETMKGKYADNYTMLEALRKYGDEQNAKHMKKAHDAGAFPIGGPYNNRDIPTIDSKKATWGKLRDGALNMLDNIDGSANNDPFSRAWFNEAGAQAIDGFGYGVNE